MDTKDSAARLQAEVARLRRELADLKAAPVTRFGLVWEREALSSEEDLHRAFVPDLVLEENGRAVSMLDDDPGNVIIEGNNLAALGVLARTHAGAFDCIFIDPPYGTGNTTWQYNDDFVDPKHRFRDSGWLSWMEPRLQRARDLLSPTGCILVCIDDTKRAVLDLLMEQVMPGRRIGSLVWRTRQGANDRGIRNLSADHEHLIVYANSGFEFGGKQKTYEMYRHYDEGSDDPWRVSDLTVNVAWNDRRAGNAYYPIHDPTTDIWYPCSPNAVWRFGSEKFLRPGKKNRKDTMEDLIRKGRVLFPKSKRVETWHTREELDAAISSGDVPRNGKGVPLLRPDLPELDFFVGKRVGWGIPQLKRYKSELAQDKQPLSSWIRSTADKDTTVKEGRTSLESGLNREGSSHLATLMGSKLFNYPKPPSLVTEVLRQATRPDSLVLDFFAGSGTTGEAVLKLNAEDDGERRFFLVSNTEATDKNPDRNLCRDVCAARIRAVQEASASGRMDYAQGLGGGFTYLRLAEYSALNRREELTPARLWTLAQLRHGCPIREWSPSDGLGSGIGADGRIFVLLPVPTAEAVAQLTNLATDAGLTVYTLYPTRLRPLVISQKIEILDAAVLEPAVPGR